MDQIFKALANQSRREVMDKIFARDGQTLSELCEIASFSRQAVSKHLQILEDAGLVVTHWSGREKLHYLNPAPVHEISERWLKKYARRQMTAISALKETLEK
ncbi:MAG: metalloregulator ArsR/SmtB family transcription factor [Gammaproteobacteria bacterium]|jgi:DNA-binding transcriptional ArsR family regulator|nr:metalloregulator ArsR/SmtB family transcription factor [Gammaproteobacteria bacterium]MCZ6715531.1 metalloregulator ArsR/SmtB family transcription factor [Gammaproteobacteria bacterium]MCZ6825921.1 metalloregulator ArsR/SmtB family transcription factor [Gammaproteobacteria bacterium]MCZ6912754.1 metalloregulator ArsR/SmtB family transcription factor [Pseudomonadota bacterium]